MHFKGGGWRMVSDRDRSLRVERNHELCIFKALLAFISNQISTLLATSFFIHMQTGSELSKRGDF